MKKCLLFLLVLVFLSSCKKKENPETGIVFSGIVPTDNNGIILGPADPTDWKFHDSWASDEKELFNGPELSLCEQDSTYKIISYPNPCNGSFALSLYISNKTILEYVIVDQNLSNIQNRKDTLVPGGWLFGITINNSSQYNNNLIRLYYKITNLDSMNNVKCEFKGHGDIKIQNN
jgi:hypothetical protein